MPDADIGQLIDSFKIGPDVKTSSWNAYHSAQSVPGLQTALDSLPIKPEHKTALWNHWHANQPQAAQQMIGTPEDNPNTPTESSGLLNFARNAVENVVGIGKQADAAFHPAETAISAGKSAYDYVTSGGPRRTAAAVSDFASHPLQSVNQWWESQPFTRAAHYAYENPVDVGLGVAGALEAGSAVRSYATGNYNFPPGTAELPKPPKVKVAKQNLYTANQELTGARASARGMYQAAEGRVNTAEALKRTARNKIDTVKAGGPDRATTGSIPKQLPAGQLDQANVQSKAAYNEYFSQPVAKVGEEGTEPLRDVQKYIPGKPVPPMSELETLLRDTSQPIKAGALTPEEMNIRSGFTPRPIAEPPRVEGPAYGAVHTAQSEQKAIGRGAVNRSSADRAAAQRALSKVTKLNKQMDAILESRVGEAGAKDFRAQLDELSANHRAIQEEFNNPTVRKLRETEVVDIPDDLLDVNLKSFKHGAIDPTADAPEMVAAVRSAIPPSPYQAMQRGLRRRLVERAVHPETKELDTTHILKTLDELKAKGVDQELLGQDAPRIRTLVEEYVSARDAAKMTAKEPAKAEKMGTKRVQEARTGVAKAKSDLTAAQKARVKKGLTIGGVTLGASGIAAGLQRELISTILNPSGGIGDAFRNTYNKYTGGH